MICAAYNGEDFTFIAYFVNMVFISSFTYRSGKRCKRLLVSIFWAELVVIIRVQIFIGVWHSKDLSRIAFQMFPK